MSKNGWVTISAIASRPGEIRVTINSKNPKLEKNEFSDQMPYHYRMYYEASLRDMGTLKADFTNRMQAAGKFLGVDHFSCTVAEAAQTIRHLAGANILAEYGGTDSYEKELSEQRNSMDTRLAEIGKNLNIKSYSGISSYTYNSLVVDNVKEIIFKSVRLEYFASLLWCSIVASILLGILQNFVITYVKVNSVGEFFSALPVLMLVVLCIHPWYEGDYELEDIKKSLAIALNTAFGWMFMVILFLTIDYFVSDMSVYAELSIKIGHSGYITILILIIMLVIIYSFFSIFLFVILFPWFKTERVKKSRMRSISAYNVPPKKKCDFCQIDLPPAILFDGDKYDEKELWQCPKCGQRVIADSYRIIATNGVSLNKP